MADKAEETEVKLSRRQLKLLELKQNGDALSPGDGSRPNSPTYRTGPGLQSPSRTPSRSPSPIMQRRSRSRSKSRTPSPMHSPVPPEEPEEPPKTKTVSFHSNTNWKNERKIQSAQDCIIYMIEGSSLIKMRSNGKQFHRYFRLLDDLSAIKWSPTTKKAGKALVPIDQIKEIRTGRNCESLRNRDISHFVAEERVFSILYGDAYESLDLIAYSPEEADIWVTGLNALIGASKSPDGANEFQILRESWLKAMFDNASLDTTGFIDQETCINLIKKLDSNIATVRVKQKLQEFNQSKTDGARGRINSQDFIDMFKEVSTRPEIYFLLIRFANKDYLTLEEFHLFLEGEQGLSALTDDKVQNIISTYEPAPAASSSGHMLIDGFTKYLMSDECDIFDPQHREVCQSMDQPLAHYFISTSHNTYLLEDQLKGPSSVDGYIRVLTCGCRCVKVDVWDGREEPVVFHGNTLTTKVSFREVIEVIGSFSFDNSLFPVILHIENHCSIYQQKIMAEILIKYLGDYLYIHPPDAEQSVSEMSPEQLKEKIILKSKKLEDDVAEDEVSDEDEGGETNKRATFVKRIKLCRELSRLISIPRLRYTDISSLRQARSGEMCSLSESSATKLLHMYSEDLVNHNKNSLTRVYPNSSRVDSSNFNPQDFWNAGIQMVALNFQTPGQMMDVYEGRFRANGGCGYILKPAVMREHISVFSANCKETIPGVAPQMLKIMVISGQCLPKPRGSSAVKANFIDPYVVIQVFGIPADCAEAKTRTVSNDGCYPIFNESFEFHINLPELALIRFVVLDDEYIGDDFIGQCTIPFDCLQTGYRHVRLLSSMGDLLDNSTLFVHVSVSNKKGGGCATPKRGSKNKKAEKIIPDINFIGLRSADDIFKDASCKIIETEERLRSLDSVWSELQEECGLGHTANMKQCLKVAINRFLSHPDPHRLSIVKENGVPLLRSSLSGPLPSHLHRIETSLDKLVLEIHQFLKDIDGLKCSLESFLKPAISMYDSLEAQLASQGIKGKKGNRARENFAWNVRTIRGLLDRLQTNQKKSLIALEQMESTNMTLKSLSNRDRSPSVREKPRLSLASRHNTSDNLNSYGSLGRSPTSPTIEFKPKSILKKSNSNIESSSLGDLRNTE